MFADAGHPGVKNCIATPWCAAYSGACLERSGIPTRKNLMARSYLQWGASVVGRAERGDVVVIWRGKRDDGITGHVFFYLGENSTHVIGIGGNQGDAVSIAKFPKSKILGIRRARTLSQSGTVRAQTVSAVTGAGAVGLVVYDAATVPALPSGGPQAGERIASGIEAAKPAIEAVASSLPHGTRAAAIAGAVLMAVTVGLAIWTIYRRRADLAEHGT
jgi:uncharacterized protein (TIGR02594 family)